MSNQDKMKGHNVGSEVFKQFYGHSTTSKGSMKEEQSMRAAVHGLHQINTCDAWKLLFREIRQLAAEARARAQERANNKPAIGDKPIAGGER